MKFRRHLTPSHKYLVHYIFGQPLPKKFGKSSESRSPEYVITGRRSNSIYGVLHVSANIEKSCSTTSKQRGASKYAAMRNVVMRSIYRLTSAPYLCEDEAINFGKLIAQGVLVYKASKILNKPGLCEFNE